MKKTYSEAAPWRRLVHCALAEHDVTLREVSVAAGVAYGRAVRLVNGYLRPRSGEIEQLLGAAREMGLRKAEKDEAAR